MSWDRASSSKQAATQEAALRTQIVDAVGPFSPFWRERLRGLGRTPAQVADRAGLAALPAVGERDVCPDGDPASAAALVLQAGESGYALHAPGPVLRRALVNRLVRPGSYRAVVEADTRPTSYVYAGLGLSFPVASTRSDLDVIARAGARLWQVLGLTAADVLVAALPLTATASLQALQLAALGAGSPALFPGGLADEVADALALLGASVLALPSGQAVRLLEDLDEAGADLSAVRTVLLVGAPSAAERTGATQALASTVSVLGVHVPDGHRLMWGECREGGPGLHTYPDLEVVELVDPETADAATAGEVVLTQLGLRGSALLRWRTADLASSVTTEPCPGCGRSVPRVVGVRRAALVPALNLRTDGPGGERRTLERRSDGPTRLDRRSVEVRRVDLRAVAAALVGRADLADWRVVAGTRARDGADELLVYVVPRAGADLADAAVGVARDVRTVAGLLPTQVVVVGADELPEGAEPSRRVLVRGTAG